MARHPSNPDAAELAVPIRDSDHVIGPASAPVTVVEYGDFQCPYCGSAHPIVKKLLHELGREIRFVFRNFPLSTVHPHAEHAAEAAEAASAQGLFWEMHDLLYENQGALEDDDLVAYAARAGAQKTRFTRELSSHIYAPRVREDFMGGVRSGVNGTPTFFINGVRHDDSFDFATLKKAIARAAE
ncbi:MAG TPA: thioredoxin domain-containing protein [Myxococcota bacterium]|nr:thioredoxin domain-containing protein [Myxococcota bacterium]